MAWIEPQAIAAEFGLAVSDRDREMASERLEALQAQPWQTIVLQHDGSYGFAEEGEPNIRSARSVMLFRTTNARMLVGQALDSLAIRGFECPLGFAEGREVPVGYRFECLVYEFKLAGRNSFEFTLG